MEARLEFLQIQARGIIHRIQATDAQLKDIDMGLVDFPAMREWTRGVLLAPGGGSDSPLASRLGGIFLPETPRRRAGGVEKAFPLCSRKA